MTIKNVSTVKVELSKDWRSIVIPVDKIPISEIPAFIRELEMVAAHANRMHAGSPCARE